MFLSEGLASLQSQGYFLELLRVGQSVDSRHGFSNGVTDQPPVVLGADLAVDEPAVKGLGGRPLSATSLILEAIGAG